MSEVMFPARTLPPQLAVGFIGAAMRKDGMTAVAVGQGSVRRAGEVLAGLALPLGEWTAILDNGSGTAVAVQAAVALAEAVRSTATVLMTRESARLFAEAFGASDPPGDRWMVLGSTARVELPGLFLAALERDDPVAAAWLLGTGDGI
jgi:hypothetical protein